jgi:5-methyltetrahydropteroyltriglutamate--homocysteine methyltransferase
MKVSSDRILTTHVGSLPRPDDVIVLVDQKDGGRAYDQAEFARVIPNSVANVVRKQVEAGIDVIGDGEQSKSSFSAYARTRLGGFDWIDSPLQTRMTSRDSLMFPDVYTELNAMHAARPSHMGRQRRRQLAVCRGPVTYIGQREVQTDVETLKTALRGYAAEEGFITAISPTNLALYYTNEYYRTQEEYVIALANAMNEEYKTIVDAGFLVQVDDPRLITYYDRTPDASLEDCRKFMAAAVEVVNHALRGIPPEKVRFHTCYSTNVAPRVHDLELKHYVDLMLKVNAGGYSIEGANPRHEHEWRIWEDVQLPADKVLMPGVVSHCVTLVEHPELVAQRILRFANVLGPERVIASADCGFATAAAGDEVHPDVAWAKLHALAEGARLATAELRTTRWRA